MPLYQVKHINKDCIVALWKIEESTQELLNRVYLTAADKKKYTRFSREPRKKEWLATRLLVQTILKKNVSIIYNAIKKPHIQGMDWNISISHKREFAGIILGRDVEVALDIELLSNRIEKVFHKFLSKDEISNIDDFNRNYHLHLLWCAKECLLKLSGKKNVSWVEDLFVYPFSQKNQCFYGKLNDCNKLPHKIKLYHERINTNYIMIWTAIKKSNDN